MIIKITVTRLAGWQSCQILTSAELCWCNAYGSQLCLGAMLDPSNVTKSSFLAYMYHFESFNHSYLSSWFNNAGI